METQLVGVTVDGVSAAEPKTKLAHNITHDTNSGQPSSAGNKGNKSAAVEMSDLVAVLDFSQKKINDILETSLSFSVEETLGRVVVAVRAVGSDEVIRQFPPEEFITVAKHIASHDPSAIDEDFLKGLLFDKHT